MPGGFVSLIIGNVAGTQAAQATGKLLHQALMALGNALAPHGFTLSQAAMNQIVNAVQSELARRFIAQVAGGITEEAVGRVLDPLEQRIGTLALERLKKATGAIGEMELALIGREVAGKLNKETAQMFVESGLSHLQLGALAVAQAANQVYGGSLLERSLLKTSEVGAQTIRRVHAAGRKLSEADLARIGEDVAGKLNKENIRKVAESGLTHAELGALAVVQAIRVGYSDSMAERTLQTIGNLSSATIQRVRDSKKPQQAFRFVGDAGDKALRFVRGKLPWRKQ